MKRIVLNAVFATLAVSIGCIIGWAFSLGATVDTTCSDTSTEQRLRLHELIDTDRIKARMKDFETIASAHPFNRYSAMTHNP